MKTTVLETRQLNKYFYEPQKFQVLKNINLQVQAGEFVALVGKSGCGKSTLMYVLSTMDTDYEGELCIRGQKLSGMKQNGLARFRNEHIGFVFQFHYLLPEFTVLQNVMLPAQKLGRYSTKEIEERAYSKLKLLGMEDQALKPTNKLSGGQQQRVAIARAMINDPAIVMGDEPTGNLDSYNTGLVLEIFQELKQAYGQTIIAVTHDDAFAHRTDRIVEMVDGRITGSNILVS
ncbi:ABC transporter ATP-binding protein [Cesiribacter sp. SM1]|uniref:ABC transporter ATP-binding protein n=1 Tax=Cesiribacter sp. SM1 TaxID=2861196 RepID=UPI001CD6C68C|nr:ABC transporter ATP-binding protein [Cesiribacter sp. SM1]